MRGLPSAAKRFHLCDLLRLTVHRTVNFANAKHFAYARGSIFKPHHNLAGQIKRPTLGRSFYLSRWVKMCIFDKCVG